MKVFPIIKKAIDGVINVLFKLKPALKINTVFSGILARTKFGTTISQSNFILLVKNKPALSIFNSVSGTAKNVVQNAALNITNKSTGTVSIAQKPAYNLQQVTYDLVRLVGGNTASLTTNGNQGWTNKDNAVSGTNGKRDGLNAIFNSNAFAGRNGTIHITYPNSLNKESFAITSVKLRYYYQVANTAFNNADVQLKWKKGGSDISLATITGNKNASVDPDVFDITSQIESWTDLDNLETKVFCNSTAIENWNCVLDAIEVEIIANRIDIL